MYIAQSSWGMMGRREERKRLANAAYKMAALEMIVSTIDTNSFPRPIHSAFQAKKIICPENKCSEKQLFFEAQHIQ